MTEDFTKLWAAAAQFSGVTSDLIEATRDGVIIKYDNIGSGDTMTVAADGLRLLLEATDDTDDPDASINQLHGALVRFLEDRT